MFSHGGALPASYFRYPTITAWLSHASANTADLAARRRCRRCLPSRPTFVYGRSWARSHGSPVLSVWWGLQPAQSGRFSAGQRIASWSSHSSHGGVPLGSFQSGLPRSHGAPSSSAWPAQQPAQTHGTDVAVMLTRFAEGTPILLVSLRNVATLTSLAGQFGCLFGHVRSCGGRPMARRLPATASCSAWP